MDKGDSASLQRPNAPSTSLRYVVELRREDGSVERVLARARGASVARAVYQACATEYPGRLITLREGRREIARTLAGDEAG